MFGAWGLGFRVGDLGFWVWGLRLGFFWEGEGDWGLGV